MLKVNQRLDRLVELFEEATLVPVIDGPYPLNELSGAFRRFGAGLHKGKIVIEAVPRESPPPALPAARSLR